MKKIVLIATALVTLMFFSQTVFAQSQINFTKMLHYEIPDELGKLIGDARVNIYDYEYNELGSIVLLNGTISETSEKFLEKPTHQIFVNDVDTLNKIFTADSFVKEFNRQRSLHNIRLEALDFIGQIKLAIGTWIVAMISLFIEPE